MRLERVPASAILPRLRVTPNAIELISANGSATTWQLSAADQAALRAEDAERDVSDRFLAHAASRLDGLNEVATFLAIVNPSSPFEDTLPNRPSRWLYRLRAVDAADHPSESGQVLPLVVHVPSRSRSVAPQIDSLEVANGVATVRVLARGEAGETLFVFHSTDDSLMSATATLATIRNRPDLTPDLSLIVRDDAGRRLVATQIVPDTNGVGLASLPVSSNGLVVHVWAVSITADGVPSRLVGPVHAAVEVGA
jgi:hypothetical protein